MIMPWLRALTANCLVLLGCREVPSVITIAILGTPSRPPYSLEKAYLSRSSKAL